MPNINVNFTDVPDVEVPLKPLTPGTYQASVEGVPQIVASKKGNGSNLVVELKILTEGEFQGRTKKCYLWLGGDNGPVRVKRLALSAGLIPGAEGFQTEDLVAKNVTIQTAVHTYQKDGETREGWDVKDFIIPTA